MPYIFANLLFLFLSCTQSQTASQFPPNKDMLQSNSTGGEHNIVLYIVIDEDVPLQQFTANFKRNGNQTKVGCTDHGGNDYDQPGDGIYVCLSTGGYTKYINVEITALTEKRQSETLFTGLLRTDNRSQNTFGFHLTRGVNQYMLIRTANSSNESAYSLEDQVWRFIILTWALMIFLYLGILWLNKRN